jgi:hypothetical protein
MPVEFVSAEEFERLTGETGSIYFESAPAKPRRKGLIFPGEPGYDDLLREQ